MKNALEKCMTKLWVQPVEVCSISLKAVLKNQFWFDNMQGILFKHTITATRMNTSISIKAIRFKSIETTNNPIQPTGILKFADQL